MSDAPKPWVIVNEGAGGRSMVDEFRRIEWRLRDAIGPVEVAFTDYAGHAEVLAREALDGGTRLIIAAGGDGTIHQVAAGFLDPKTGRSIHPKAALGVIPGGTGGDLAKTLGVHTVDRALRALEGGRRMAVDLGRIEVQAEPVIGTGSRSAAARITGNGVESSGMEKGEGGTRTHHFLNIASVGLGGAVLRRLPDYSVLGGGLAYAAATVHALWSWKNPRIRWTIDGGPSETGNIVSIAVANGQYFGGGMRIAPKADLADGRFDITIIGDLGRLETLALTRSIYEGGHIYSANVSTAHATRMQLAPADPSPVSVEADGEVIGWLPASIELVPQAIDMVVP